MGRGGGGGTNHVFLCDAVNEDKKDSTLLPHECSFKVFVSATIQPF